MESSAIPFGKHKGCIIEDVPVDYILWLSGLSAEENLEDLLVDEANLFWTNRNYYEKFLCCPNKDKIHDQDCPGLCLADTEAKTIDLLTEKILSEEFIGEQSHRLKPWLWVKKYHNQWIQKARTFIDVNKLCLFCGKKLVPIGNARQNGKFHNDWDSRKLHKKCWKELRDRDY